MHLMKYLIKGDPELKRATAEKESGQSVAGMNSSETDPRISLTSPKQRIHSDLCLLSSSDLHFNASLLHPGTVILCWDVHL